MSDVRSVTDIPDERHVERAVHNAGRGGKRQPRWVAVMETFSLGSTFAQQMCVRFDLDPDEMVGGRR